MNKLYITNARIVLPDKVIPRGTIIIEGKRITGIRRGKSVPSGAVEKIDARGNFAAPGFIDLHIHGDIEKISRQQIKGGTAGFLATLHPAKPKALIENISEALTQKAHGAKVLGIRLEGPFLNRSFCGALPRQALRPPDISEMKAIIKRAHGALKMVILAPELKNALELIRLLKRNKIVPSIGHTGATYEEAERGIDCGITEAAHTFNRMRGFDHRSSGALEAVLVDSRVDCEVIADGIHVHPALLALLLKCKSADKVSLITDSTAAQKYPLKKRSGSIFKLKDGTLYGTALTLNKALKNIIRFLDLSMPEAVKMVTLNPARVLKIDKKKGSIAVGKDADIVIFDKSFNVKMTMVEGEVKYKCAA